MGQPPIYAGAGSRMGRRDISNCSGGRFSAGCMPFDPVSWGMASRLHADGVDGQNTQFETIQLANCKTLRFKICYAAPHVPVMLTNQKLPKATAYTPTNNKHVKLETILEHLW